MSFPKILEEFMQHGFESYHVDYLRGIATYYVNDGDSVELPTPQHNHSVSKDFQASAVQSAVKEAQQNIKGYTYWNFCRKVMEAGCVGYIVSLLGKRVLYLGRTTETHVEHFP